MILFKYINKRFFIILLTSLLAILLLSFLIDTIESSKTITQEEVKISTVFQLILNKFIILAIQTFPLAVYISLMLVLFNLHIKNEYLSLLTSGIRPEKLIIIVSPAIILCGIIYFFLIDSILPKVSREVDRLLVFEFKRFTASWTYFYRDRNWFLGKDGVIYHYDEIDENSKSMKNFSIYILGKDGVDEIILAENIKSTNGRHYFAEQVREFKFQNNGTVDYNSYNSKEIVLADEYDIFRQRRGRPYQMSLSELMSLINIRNRIGLDTSRYKYEFYNRILNPLSFILLCLLMLFLFIKRLYFLKSRFVIFYSMIILLIFFLLVTFSGKLSETSLNMPFLAAVIPLLFLVLMNLIVVIQDKQILVFRK